MTYFAPGDYNAICHDCGRKAKASELVKHWKGYYVCSWHIGANRHPQDFVRGVAENPAAPYTQNIPDTFAGYCSPNGTSAVPGWAEPGCATPNYLNPAFDLGSPV